MEKLYTQKEVVDLFQHFMSHAPFVTFTNDVGVTGWDEFDKWIAKNIVNKNVTVNDKYR